MKHAPSNRKLQTTPADGGANIIRSPESGSGVDAAISSPEVRVVVEQPVADDSPSPAGSDVKKSEFCFSLTNDGALIIALDKSDMVLEPANLRELGRFLISTEPAWA